MRKIALLTVPFLILGFGSVWADDAGLKADEDAAMKVVAPKVEIGGHSHLTFGIDLDTNATGFKSDNHVDLKVTLIPKNTVNTGMMPDADDLYAYVELKDFKWEINSADGSGKTSKPSITTKLFMGPFSVKTYSSPSVVVDFVDPKDDDKKGDPGYPDFVDLKTEYKGSAGLTLGYKLDPVDLSLGVLSMDDWTQDKPDDKDKDACHYHGDDPDTKDKVEGPEHVRACKGDEKDNLNDDNAYAFLGTIKLAIGDDANVETRVAYAHEYASGGSPIGIGSKATFDLGDIDPHVAFDAAIPPDGSDVPFDVGAGLKWDISPNDDKSYFETTLMMHAPGGDAEQNLGVQATLKEGDADEGALEGLGASLTLDLYNLTSDESEWGVTVDAHYKVNDIKPFFMVKFSNAGDAATSFKAGLELTMIEHLTSTLQYKSDDITGGTDKGEVTAALKIAY